MGDSRSYYDDRLEEYETQVEFSKEVIDILDLFRLLSIENKVAVKRLIEKEKQLEELNKLCNNELQQTR